MIDAHGATNGTGPTPSRFLIRRMAGSCCRSILLLAILFGTATAPARAHETPTSWVRFKLDVPLALLNEELERRVPRDGGGTRHITLAEGFDLEISGEREPFRLTGHGDSLVARTRLGHCLYVQGAGLKRAGCGSARAPLSAELACTARFGWNDAFSARMRTTISMGMWPRYDSWFLRSRAPQRTQGKSLAIGNG